MEEPVNMASLKFLRKLFYERRLQRLLLKSLSI